VIYYLLELRVWNVCQCHELEEGLNSSQHHEYVGPDLIEVFITQAHLASIPNIAAAFLALL
jgi:hypothetical protein